MPSDTLLNSENDKTFINTSSISEVDNLTGTIVLEKYTLLNRINDSSGEATLYKAVCNISKNSSAHNSYVVIKIYRRKDAIKPEVLGKLAKLKSPGIVEIIDHGFYNGFPCVVMPYYMNGSLAGKTLSYDVIKDIVIPEVTEGLKYLHKNGIIHKDIKPANLMISNDGKHVHIIDFGISSAKDDGVSILITKTGMSPEYCAPETFNNVWVEESDFYSFGITIFELFKGHTPFNYSSDKNVLAASASIQKISFSLDFPSELVNLIKGLTYKDLSNRNDPNNPNRRWTWKEIEKWLSGEKIPVPGEFDSNNQDSESRGIANKSSAYIFSKPYDFRNNLGQIVKLNNLSEFTEAFGLNWNDGKKHVGRGFASKFFIQQDMQNPASIIMDCEEAGITDMAYAKMLIELGASTENYGLYWNSVKVNDNMKYLSDVLTDTLYNRSNFLNRTFENITQLLCFWYEKVGKDKELCVIKNLQKIAKEKNQDLTTQVIVLCSFISPNMVIKIGDNIFQTVDELMAFTHKQKFNNKQQYFEWIHDNENDIKRYAECIDSKIKNCSEKLLNDLEQELKRREEEARKRREEEARKRREEQARKRREEQERKRREEEERKRREEEERKRREEEERKRREEQERKRREEQERKEREEQERKEREERKIKLQEELVQAPKEFLAAINKGLQKGMVIPFGSYPQDKNGFRAPIKWLVLDVVDNKALLISRYGLDCRLYNQADDGNLTWENSDLRKWLNADFIETAFTKEETRRIKLLEHTNDDNPEYGTRGGNNTQDRVFCLSIAEAKKYFSCNEDRKCESTPYAQTKGVHVSNNCCNWWLRSPGGNQGKRINFIFGGMNYPDCCFAVDVFPDGGIPLCGHAVWLRGAAVRPAIRIVINEELEKQREEQEEQERKQREEQERKQREEQEEQERKQREEQERKQREEEQREFWATIKGIQKGTTIRFGRYPQGNSNARTPIEWIVLDVKKSSLFNRLFGENKLEILLISRYALDCKLYHNKKEYITWESSDLRKWLNNDFLKSAFSDDEAKMIRVSDLKNDDNLQYGTPGGNNTQDLVFCLSFAEIEEYFNNDKDRICEPTAHACELGAFKYEGHCRWWLRSPGLNQDGAMFVDTNGFHKHSYDVTCDFCSIRPALRIICNL
jgi:serine/threonine protein kinase/flagellar biosynthesis GTPase FlhF